MIKYIVITIQFLVIVYLLQIANAGTKVNRAPSQIVTVPTQYEKLVEELLSLRQFTFGLCFNENVDISTQNEYCYAYNVLDVALYQIGLENKW